MRLTNHLHLIGSGRLGFDLTDALDCHVFLVTDSDTAFIVDTGAGRDIGAILRELDADGIPRSTIAAILLTHAHADHAGGARGLADALGVPVRASATAADYLSRGDEQAISLDRARDAGGYPADYRYAACEVMGDLADGDRIALGELAIEVIATPGHCGGHLSFALHRPDGIDVLAGDAVFAGGRILLQDIWDCSVSASCRSVERLGALRPDGLYPAHGAFARDRGHLHLDRAMEAIGGLLPPPQFG